MRAALSVRSAGPQPKRARPDAASRKGGRSRARLPRLAPWLPSLALAACAGGPSDPSAPSPPGPVPALEPAQAVAAFLEAAARRDHAGMAARFGAGGGPIGETGGTLGCAFAKALSLVGLADRCLTAREVELRMDLMAAILAHESYRVGGRETVAGRGRPAVRVSVEITAPGRPGAWVPFIVERAPEGGWMVAQVGLDALTR